MRPRAWRITMWTSLAATVLLAGGAIDKDRGWDTRFERTYAALQDGCLYFGNDDAEFEPIDWLRSGPEVFPTAWFSVHRWVYAGVSYWTLCISLWLPAGATFAVSGLSTFMVYRTRRRPGHCPKCGYDRSGLPTDAPCPECGHARA